MKKILSLILFVAILSTSVFGLASCRDKNNKGDDGINYDIGTIFETDKDAKKGEYYWVLTAWGDQQIRLKSAFRLAVVSA